MTREEALTELFSHRCPICGHSSYKVASIHAKPGKPKVSLVVTHWDITEVDEGESTGIGCTICESNSNNLSEFCDPLQKCRKECCNE